MSLWKASDTSIMRSERADERRAAQQGWLLPTTLRLRANDAARSIMRGLPPEDRADCASAILAEGLAAMPATTGKRRAAKSRQNPNVSAYRRALAAEARERATILPVRADDPRHSFTAYKHRAEHFRRDLLKRRQREAAHDNDMIDRERTAIRQSGRSLVAHVEEDERERKLTTPADAARDMADAAAWSLSRVPYSAVDGRAYSNVWTLLFSELRGEDAPVVANDLGCEVSAVWQRQSRGRSALRKRHATARDLLLALLGTEPEDGTLPAAHKSGARLAAEWRSRLAEVAPIVIRRARVRATIDRLVYPAAPRSAEVGGVAVGPPIMRRVKRPPLEMTDEQRAQSLRRLAGAQFAAMQSTLPTKPLSTKSGHAGQTGIHS